MSRSYKKDGVEVNTPLDKSKKYKYNKSGDLVESTGTPGTNEIVMSGSKSSLRRMADMERNITILATTLTTDDGLVDDGHNASYDSNIAKTTRFKQTVRMDSSLDMQATIDMNGEQITSVGTPTVDTDAANKTYVDTAISGSSFDNVYMQTTEPTTLVSDAMWLNTTTREWKKSVISTNLVNTSAMDR